MSQQGKVHNFTTPQEDYSNSFDWEAVGSISGVNAALAGANLLAATAEALTNTVAYQPSFGTVAVEFRFYTDDASDNETYTMNVYARVGTDDYYTKVGVLTLTVGSGQKGSASILWCDGVALDATDKWITTIRATAPADSTPGKLILNAHGYRSFLFMSITGGTSADADTMYVEARRF